MKENLERLTEELRDCASLSLDSLKLHLVETLSVLVNDLLSYLLFAAILLLTTFFVLVALCLMLVPLLGAVGSALMVALLLSVVAAVVYLGRNYLFVNAIVARLCRLLFQKRCPDEQN